MTDWQLTPLSLLYFAGLALSMLVLAAAWRMRPVRGATEFAIMSLGITVWIAGFIVGFFNTNLAWKLIAVRIEYLGIVLSPVYFFLFVASYIQIRLPYGWQFLLFGPAIATLLVVLTFPLHNLFYLDYGVDTLDSGFVVFRKEYGPFFYGWMGWSYIIMMASFLMIAWGLSRMPRRYRAQATMMALIIATILGSNVTFVSGYNPIAPYDPTPLSFLVAAILVLFNMRFYRFLDIVPVAHNLVFEQVPTGVVVLNLRDSVIEANSVAASAVGTSRDTMLGEPFDQWFELEGEHMEQVRLPASDRVFDIEVRALTDATGHRAGRIVLLHDVTEYIEMSERQELLIADLRTALASVRMLEGMLPICANCKKIRDDNDEWHELEKYIDEHSEAQFSHGICPSCAKELYGDYET